jgi:hypothetical protein
VEIAYVDTMLKETRKAIFTAFVEIRSLEYGQIKRFYLPRPP